MRPASIPMVGRERERGAVDESMRAASDGRAQVLVVRGEAGIGKTRLVQAMLDDADRTGWVTAVGHVTPVVGSDLPMAPIIEALTYLADSGLDLADLAPELTPTLRVLLPQLGPAPAGAEPVEAGLARSRLFTSVRLLLERIGALRPVMLVIEDLHWADPSTLGLVGFLARTLRRERILLVLTLRDGGLASEQIVSSMTELLRLPETRLIELVPMSTPDVSALLRMAAPERSDRDRLAHRSGGNPFFALELAHTGSDETLPRHFTELVLAAHIDLPPGASSVLRTAAVLGEQVDEALLSAAVDLTAAAFAEAARVLVERRLLTSSSGHYDFRHAIVREVVAGDLTVTERLAIHRRIVAGIRASGLRAPVVPAAEWAHHLLAAGEHDEGVRAAITAGDEANAVFAFAEARSQYAAARTAFHLLDPSARPAEVTGAALLLREGVAAVRSGDPVAAVELLRAAQTDPELAPQQRSTLGEALGDALWECGRTTESLAAYDAALGSVAADPDPSLELRARIRSAYAKGLLLSGHLDAAMTTAKEAVRLAVAAGVESHEIQALITCAIVDAIQGRAEAGLAALQDCLARARELGDFGAVLRCAGNLTYVQLLYGRYAEAWRTAEDSLAAGRAFGPPLAVAGTLVNNGVWALFASDQWDECARQGAAALAEWAPHGSGAFLHLTLAELAVARGEDLRVQAHLAAAAAEDSDDSYTITAIESIRTEQLLWAGQPAEARLRIDRALDQFDDHEDGWVVLSLRALQLRTIADQIESAPPAELRDDLLDAVARDLAAAHEIATELPPLRALIRLCEAEAARARREDTAAQWTEVSVAWSTLGRPYPRAYALRQRAARELRARARTQAAVSLRLARDLAEELGARPLLASITQLATAGGVLAEVEAPRPPPASPRPAQTITPREQQVLVLLSEGLTNRQIASRLYISERTAAVHVSNLLAKLGVSNRLEAANAGRAKIPPPE